MKSFDCPVRDRSRSRQNRRWLVASSSLLWLVFGVSAFAAQSARLDLIRSLVPGYLSSRDISELPVADFDGDGRPDLVAVGSQNLSDVLLVVGVDDSSGWKTKQILVPEMGSYAYYQKPIIGTWTSPDGAQLFYVQGRQVNTYSGWPLTLDHQFQLTDVGFVDAVVADVDNDGSHELIVASNFPTQALLAYSSSTGTLLWTIPNLPMYGARLRTAQLDADPALEIVLSGNPGTIIDGATHAIEWEYKDGFGEFVRAGNFGGATPRFASLDSRITMFQSGPWSPLWDLGNIYADAVAVADLNGDGIDELICACRYPAGVHTINTQTHSINLLLADDFVAQVAAADFDGDSQVEIAIARSSVNSAPQAKRLQFIDPTSGSTEFSIPVYAPGPYVAGGYIAESGNIDLIFGSRSGTTYAGVLTRVDAYTGAVRWRDSPLTSNFDLLKVETVSVTQLAGQTHPVVLASGWGGSSSSYGGKIIAVDADDGTLLWTISHAEGNVPDPVGLDKFVTVDLSGDVTTDAILACSGDKRLRLFDTGTQTQTWASVTMSGECQGAFVARTGGSLQLIAAMSGGLRAYDAQTHLLSWSLPVAGLWGATYISQGVANPELAVYTYQSIRFFDAESRSLLREITFANLTPIQAVAQPTGASIHELAVSINEKLYIVDGETGEIRGLSSALGQNSGQFNQLATYTNSDGSYLIGTGSDVGVFTHRIRILPDIIFASGFDPAIP